MVTATRPLPRLLLPLALAVLLASLGISLINIGLPTLAQAFDASFAQVQWLVLGYLLTTTTLVVGMGRLGDRVGLRRLLMLGLSLFVLGSLLGGLAPALPWLLGARVLQGCGAAVMMTLPLALVRATAPDQHLGRAVGLLASMSSLGTALGPALGGLLLVRLPWPALFLTLALAGLLALALLWWLPTDAAAATPRASTPLGVARLAWLGLGLGAFAFLLTVLTAGTWPTIALALLASVLGMGMAWQLERRSRTPLLELGLLRQPGLRTGCLLNLLTMAVVITTLLVGPFHLAGAFGLDATAVGLCMAAGPLASALSAGPAGRLVDRLGTRALTHTGMLLMLAGSLTLASTPLHWGVAGYLVPLVLLTTGYAVFQAANSTAVMRLAPAGQQGMVSGILTLSRNLGMSLGTALMGAIYGAALASAHQATPATLLQSLHLTFGLASAALLLALLLRWLLPWWRPEAV